MISRDVKRVLYGGLALVAGLLLIVDEGPPLWVVWIVLFVAGLAGYRDVTEEREKK